MRRSGGGGDIQNVQVGKRGDGAPRNTVIEQLLTALSRHTAKICISTAARDMRGMVLIGWSSPRTSSQVAARGLNRAVTISKNVGFPVILNRSRQEIG